jgi:hypothetical protein
MAPTYRERLRAEGLVLAVTGAVGSAAVLAATPQSRRWPLNTAVQLGLAAALVATVGRRKLRKAMDAAVELQPGAEGGGGPTPLWRVPLAPAVLTLLAGGSVLSADRGPRFRGQPLAGWDAVLRATAATTVAGIAQALLFERDVAQAETIQGRTYYRIESSGPFAGTQLGYTRRA